MMTTTIYCPQCKKPTTWQDNPNRPFCTSRCKLIDLGEWASQGYVISDTIVSSNTMITDTTALSSTNNQALCNNHAIDD